MAKKPKKEAPQEREPKTFTPQTEWLKNRLRDRGVSLDAAAETLGTYKLMLHRILGGSRPARPDEILDLAPLLGVSPIEAIRRFGYTVPETKIDVVGKVNEFGRIEWFPPDLIRRTEAPADATANMRALTVDAPQSRLAIYDGAMLYYSPLADRVDAQAVGRLAVIGLGDQPAPLVGVLSYAAGDRKRVTVIGGAEVIESKQLIFAAPIVWIRAL